MWERSLEEPQVPYELHEGGRDCWRWVSSCVTAAGWTHKEPNNTPQIPWLEAEVVGLNHIAKRTQRGVTTGGALKQKDRLQETQSDRSQLLDPAFPFLTSPNIEKPQSPQTGP